LSRPLTPAAGLLALLAILACGALLVAPRLGAQSLWLDEAFTLIPVVEAHGFADLLDRVRHFDTQPPASHIALYLTRDLLPDGDAGHRLPSFLAVEIGIALLAGAVARLWGWPAGLVAAGAAQFSPYLIWYALEARNYGLWFLAVVTSFYCLVRWIEALGGPGNAASTSAGGAGRGQPADADAVWTWAILWGFASAVGLWTHMFHLFAMVGQVVAVLIAGRPAQPLTRRRAGLSLFMAIWLALLLFSPWILGLARRAGLLRGVGWTRQPTLLSLIYYPFALMFDSSLGPDLRELHTKLLLEIIRDHPLSLAAGAVALSVMGFAWWRLVRDAWRSDDRRWEAAVLLFAPSAGLLGPALYAVLLGFPLVPRHLMFVFPLLPVATALAWLRMPRLRPALAAVAALQLLTFGNLLWNGRFAKDDERGAVRFAEASSEAAGTYILGDVAPLYTTRAHGMLLRTVDLGLEPEWVRSAQDIYYVEVRRWEQGRDRYLEKLARLTEREGLPYKGHDLRFLGVRLHHWARAAAAPSAEGR
jgi:4-amino-4-deoxy-L-arabinose transferase-like glycosyltransferase